MKNCAFSRCVRLAVILLATTFFLPASVPVAEAAAKSRATPFDPVKIRSFVQRMMQEWQVPGVALGIVRNGRVIFAEGFGWRDVQKKLPVTARTRFILGSTTKAFTTAAIAILADEGKLEWDKPVADYIPWFTLMDEWAGRHATVRDLAAHRTGLPRHDRIWDNTKQSLKEIVENLRFLEPCQELRAGFQYNNLMYMTLGYLVGQAAGSSWEDVVRSKIFQPLAMTESGCTIADFEKAADRALAYDSEEKEWQALPLASPAYPIQYGPRASGSVNSTASDMCRWLLLQIGGGKIDGHQVISPAQIVQMHSAQINMPTLYLRKKNSMHESYGLGWMVNSYRGNYRVRHDGRTQGFDSHVSFFPHDDFGTVVLANRYSPLPVIVSAYVSDLLLNLDPLDVNKLFRDLQQATQPPPAKPRVSGTQPAHPLPDYAGEYHHPAYGDLTVTAEADSLKVIFHDYASPLEHWHYETFRIVSSGLADTLVTFRTDDSGVVASAALPLEPSVKPIVFAKIVQKIK